MIRGGVWPAVSVAAWLGAAALFAPIAVAQCGYSPTNLSLPDTSYPLNTYASGTSLFSATTSITAGGSNGNFTVEDSASVVFQAGSTITLLPGFTAGGSGSPAFRATITPVSQYQLTTAASPSGEGTITASPCSSNGYYSSGTVVTLTAQPHSGYYFVNWSTGSTANPLYVTMSSAQSITANFGTVRSLPTPGATGFSLSGFNYFPRGHAFPRMLYDWSSDDCSTSTIAQTGNGAWVGCAGSQGGSPVSQIAAADLQTLSQNGFNFVHLYLWDQDLLYNNVAAGPPTCKRNPPLNSVNTGPGFVSFQDSYTPSLQGPSSSPNDQWDALASFVGKAQSAGAGISVFLELATARVYNELDQIAPANVPNGNGGCMASSPSLTTMQQSQIALLAADYAAWVDLFIDKVASHPNVLVWAVNYGIPGTDGTAGTAATIFWQNAWPAILTHLAQDYPSNRPRLALDLDLPSSGLPADGDVAAQLSPYQWNWQLAQIEAYGWQALGIQPDNFAIQAYTPSHADFQTAVNCVAGTANQSMCPASPPPPQFGPAPAGG